jgi:uncharacterized protein (DUF427 family)
VKPNRIEPGPGQESVWDYPRPPRLEATNRHIQVVFNGQTVVDTHQAIRVLETSHAPVYYVPPPDVDRRLLIPVPGYTTLCEWKGQASYFDVLVGDRRAQRAAWTYHNPTPTFQAIKDYLAFYVQFMDLCLVDGEPARPQPGRFYGGWVTDDIVGPFKGEPGTEWW